MLHNSFQVLKCHITTIMIRMINNSATHATTDTVAIVRGRTEVQYHCPETHFA